MKRDMHNAVDNKVALKIQQIASDTTTAGEIIDLGASGEVFDSLEFLVQTGTVTDGDYTVLIQHGDESNLSDAANVADADLLGTEAGASFSADTDDDKTSKIGYRGAKRYVRLSIVSTNTSSGAYIGAQALLGHPLDTPKSDQKPEG